MDLKFALLADFVNETKEGKANIIGEFDRIHSPTVPVVHPFLSIAARFEAHISEGTDHEVQIGLYDEDGKEILPLSPPIPLKFVAIGRGKPLRGNIIAQLSGVNFPHYGDYAFHLLVDGRHMASVPFTVAQMPTPKRHR